MTLPKHLRTPSLRVLLRRLRKNAPLSAPVRIVQQKGVRIGTETVLGYASYTQRVRNGKWSKPKRFRIVIDSRLAREEKWNVIVHEWAHCLDRDIRPKRPRDVHDSRWGICLARAWRASLP